MGDWLSRNGLRILIDLVVIFSFVYYLTRRNRSKKSNPA
jgi:hypothetical protein